MFTKRLTEQLSQQASARISVPKHKSELTDLANQLWPILRRVSYAMSDATWMMQKLSYTKK